jgi:hypothetical protein
MTTSIEQRVRDAMGLSKSHKRPVPVPVPSVPAKKEAIIDVDAECRLHPQLRWHIDKDRNEGFSERTIRNMIPTYKRILGIEEPEDVARRELGLPSAKKSAEPSELEKRLRKEGRLV